LQEKSPSSRGAAGGIGKALVDAFVKEDLRVVALDIDEKGVRALQDKHGDAKVLGLRVDVSDPEDCRRQVATVAERLGTVHILVNNAALGMNSGADAYDDEHLQGEDVPDDLWRGSLPSTWGRLLHDALGGSNFPQAEMGARHQRLHQHDHDDAQGLRALWADQGRAGSLVADPFEATRGQRHYSQCCPARRPGGHGHGARRRPKRAYLPQCHGAADAALFTEAGAAVTGQRFIAVEWDESLGIDPAAQPHALAAWPQLAKPFSKMRQRA
jgi:hypothetical protein